MSEKNEKTKNLLTRAFRTKQGITERLLCMRLIQGTFATDIKSIIANTCMASSMVEEGYPNKLKDFDFKKFRIMKQIYSDINETEYASLAVQRRKSYYYETEYLRTCPIPWSIEQTEEIYKKYIEPWMPSTLNYHEEGIQKHRKGDHIVTTPYWSYFWEATLYLSLRGFKKFRTAFYEWLRDECGKAIMTMGTLVSQNIYDEVLKQLKAGPDESKESKSKRDKWEAQ